LDQRNEVDGRNQLCRALRRFVTCAAFPVGVPFRGKGVVAAMLAPK
jgi:hypothetical protein